MRYVGITSGEAIVGANIFRDLFASVRDIVGGRAGAYENVLASARETALAEMRENAERMGANAVVGVDLDYETLGSGGSMLMVCASGTAVVDRVRRLPATAQPMRRILGIDPGLRVTGYGLIEARGNRSCYVASGCVRGGRRQPADAPGRHRARPRAPDRGDAADRGRRGARVRQRESRTRRCCSVRRAARRSPPPCSPDCPVHRVHGGAGEAGGRRRRARARSCRCRRWCVRLLALPGAPQADAADALACGDLPRARQRGMGLSRPGYRGAGPLRRSTRPSQALAPRSSARQRACVIFDMDGLMLDTEPLAARAWTRCGDGMRRRVRRRRCTLRWSDARSSIAARCIVDASRRSVSGRHADGRMARRLRCDRRARGHGAQAGLVELLDWLEARGIPKAVATSTRRARARTKLERTGLCDRFAALVGGDEIAQGKPAPDIFLAAAERLGDARPATCLVLEDSEAGMTAALRAPACPPIMVPDLRAASSRDHRGESLPLRACDRSRDVQGAPRSLSRHRASRGIILFPVT